MEKFFDKFVHEDSAWMINEDNSSNANRKLYEALFTLSNGYLGMRGINEDMTDHTCPGTYVAGAFDKSECIAVEMVNFPNPIPLYLVIDGEKIDLDKAEIINHKRFIDLKYGTIVRDTVFKMGQKETRYRSIRFVCRHERNSAMIISEVTPLNWSGDIKIVSELDGTAHNAFANYFPDEWVRHFWLVSINDNYDPDTVMVVRTRDSDYKYCLATYLMIDQPYEKVKRYKKIYGERVIEEATVSAVEGQSIIMTKYISVEDTKHVACEELVRVTTNTLNRNKLVDVGSIWEKHKSAWESKWNVADIRVSKVEGQSELNSRIRFNIYQLLMLGSDTDYRHGIGIKGFTGEMYRGHYFWDTEMYMFPFYLYTNPILARNLLVFRHRILPAALKNAMENGFKGMLYSWEVDEQGVEGLNQEINRETGAMRRREILDQYHINLAVMYALFSYYRATKDLEFMINYGADIIVQNMRFWESFLIWNEKEDRYETHNVMGPDEYHSNINNNFYTNYLLKAITKKSLEFIEECRNTYKNAFYKITSRHLIKEDEITLWNKIYEKIYLPKTVQGVLEQFEGYFGLKEYTFKKRNEFGIPIVVELEDMKDPKNPLYSPDLTAYHEALVRMSNEMRIIKQADTVLLFNIFPFDFDEEVVKNTLLFYEERTLHYSSLSPGVYALCAARISEMELAVKYFNLSLDMDLKDIKKESENALHTPTSGEVYTIITQGFAGLFPDGDTLVLKPNIPEGWDSIEFNYLWRKTTLSFKICKHQVEMISKGLQETLIYIGGKQIKLSPGKTVIVGLS